MWSHKNWQSREEALEFSSCAPDKELSTEYDGTPRTHENNNHHTKSVPTYLTTLLIKRRLSDKGDSDLSGYPMVPSVFPSNDIGDHVFGGRPRSLQFDCSASIVLAHVL